MPHLAKDALVLPGSLFGAGRRAAARSLLGDIRITMDQLRTWPGGRRAGMGEAPLHRPRGVLAACRAGPGFGESECHILHSTYGDIWITTDRGPELLIGAQGRSGWTACAYTRGRSCMLSREPRFRRNRKLSVRSRRASGLSGADACIDGGARARGYDQSDSQRIAPPLDQVGGRTGSVAASGRAQQRTAAGDVEIVTHGHPGSWPLPGAARPAAVACSAVHQSLWTSWPRSQRRSCRTQGHEMPG